MTKIIYSDFLEASEAETIRRSSKNSWWSIILIVGSLHVMSLKIFSWNYHGVLKSLEIAGNIWHI